MQKRYSESGLVLIEKYDKFLHYIYPHLQEIPRKHGILKEKIILLVFHQAELIYRVVKTKPINKTKLYELDAGHATKADSYNLLKLLKWELEYARFNYNTNG